jgi:glycosyltransferase involved in cell wall biosynthesis
VSDVIGLLQLADWEPIKRQSRILCPVPTPFLGRILNRWFAPILPFLCLSIFMTARPKPRAALQERTVSVVIPARNEAGNIRAAVERTPSMGTWTELIFVEGNSHDATWEEIKRIEAAYPERRIKTLKQTGRGKGNAVREGFAAAQGDILMILDADLTMPPEDLPKFFAALTNGHCELANGSRLVYPMEPKAMRFLNMCANKTFSILFTWLLGQPVKDTLCGTKVLTREAYRRIVSNRSYFGDFDPFGDFDLLFGADKLNLKIIDVPIRYQDRTYGKTNILRWTHGLMLLKMVFFAARKLKFV